MFHQGLFLSLYVCVCECIYILVLTGSVHTIVVMTRVSLIKNESLLK